MTRKTERWAEEHRRVGWCVSLACIALSGLPVACDKKGNAERGGQVDALAEECRQVTGEGARILIEQGATLVDVRTPREYQQRHLDGAKLIPHTEVEQHLQEIPKGQPVVVYCRSGRRSEIAAEELREHGYRVYNLGGIDDWDTKGDACAG